MKINIYLIVYKAPEENICNQWTDPLDGCPEPVWYADGYCADENNIEACNYDGGDCCGEKVNKQWCKQCECLDPNFVQTTTTTTAKPDQPCKDTFSKKKCKKIKSKGKCNKKQAKKNCKETCGHCT